MIAAFSQVPFFSRMLLLGRCGADKLLVIDGVGRSSPGAGKARPWRPVGVSLERCWWSGLELKIARDTARNEARQSRPISLVATESVCRLIRKWQNTLYVGSGVELASEATSGSAVGGRCPFFQWRLGKEGCYASFKACETSAIRSDGCSMPIDSRIVESRTPIFWRMSAGMPE